MNGQHLVIGLMFLLLTTLSVIIFIVIDNKFPDKYHKSEYDRELVEIFDPRTYNIGIDTDENSRDSTLTINGNVIFGDSAFTLDFSSDTLWLPEKDTSTNIFSIDSSNTAIYLKNNTTNFFIELSVGDSVLSKNGLRGKIMRYDDNSLTPYLYFVRYNNGLHLWAKREDLKYINKHKEIK